MIAPAKRFLLACLLWCAAGPALAAGPAIWSVQGKHNTLYLVGTIHFLHPEDKLPGNIDAVYGKSKKLLMEIDMDDLDPGEAQQTMLELGMLPPPDSLRQQVGEPAYSKLQQHADKLGLDPALLDRFQPWLAALTLEQLQLMQMGMEAEAGVEQQLLAKAKDDHKEIEGLETLKEQLGMFAGFNREQQRQLLLYSLDDLEQSDTELQSLLTAWRNGDVAAMGKMLQSELLAYPQLYRALTVERNRRWITMLRKILEDGRDDYLVAVGALHLVGQNSVVDLLQQAGYRVQRQ